MGLPSGTFNKPDSGKLTVSFSVGKYQANSSDWGSGDWSLALRGIADDGTNRRTVVVDIKYPSNLIEFDYVGGTNVAVSMEVISYHIVGTGTVSAKDVRIRCTLVKR